MPGKIQKTTVVWLLVGLWSTASFADQLPVSTDLPPLPGDNRPPLNIDHHYRELDDRLDRHMKTRSQKLKKELRRKNSIHHTPPAHRHTGSTRSPNGETDVTPHSRDTPLSNKESPINSDPTLEGQGSAGTKVFSSGGGESPSATKGAGTGASIRSQSPGRDGSSPPDLPHEAPVRSPRGIRGPGGSLFTDPLLAAPPVAPGRSHTEGGGRAAVSAGGSLDGQSGAPLKSGLQALSADLPRPTSLIHLSSNLPEIHWPLTSPHAGDAKRFIFDGFAGIGANDGFATSFYGGVRFESFVLGLQYDGSTWLDAKTNTGKSLSSVQVELCALITMETRWSSIQPCFRYGPAVGEYKERTPFNAIVSTGIAGASSKFFGRYLLAIPLGKNRLVIDGRIGFSSDPLLFGRFVQVWIREPRSGLAVGVETHLNQRTNLNIGYSMGFIDMVGGR